MVGFSVALPTTLFGSSISRVYDIDFKFVMAWWRESLDNSIRNQHLGENHSSQSKYFSNDYDGLREISDFFFQWLFTIRKFGLSLVKAGNLEHGNIREMSRRFSKHARIASANLLFRFLQPYMNHDELYIASPQRNDRRGLRFAS
jgi:hypothetical protein